MRVAPGDGKQLGLGIWASLEGSEGYPSPSRAAIGPGLPIPFPRGASAEFETLTEY